MKNKYYIEEAGEINPEAFDQLTLKSIAFKVNGWKLNNQKILLRQLKKIEEIINKRYNSNIVETIYGTLNDDIISDKFRIIIKYRSLES